MHTPDKETTGLSESRENLDFRVLTRDLKEYASTRNHTLEEKLFPWWFHEKADNNARKYFDQNDKSKGIVICTGDRNFLLALVALTALESIGNQLPIEVTFSSSSDLSISNREKLLKLFPNITLVDLSVTSFNDSYLELRGWEIKPFAVLGSQFRQVLLMDADVLFLEKPSVLFENSFYLKTGSLFFYDRTSFSMNLIKWIKTISPGKNRLSIPRRTQEAGVVVIDKARVLPGLLSACKLNAHHERERVTYKKLHGDKDTWWLGFYLVQMPFSFIPTPTASIGHIANAKRNLICGHILHLDENYRPIWWNGGSFKQRYVDTKNLLVVDGWLIEGYWRLQEYSCLINYKKKAKEFTPYQLQLISNYSQITRKIYNIQ